MKGRIEIDDVIISKGDFEHLLNCLANQKWLPTPEKQAGIELECQTYIDKCWIEGMELLNSKPTITSEAQKFFEDFAKEIELQPRPPFKQALTTLINQYSKENGSDTPDFILAKFLTDTLKAFNKATNKREELYGDEINPFDDSDPFKDQEDDDWDDESVEPFGEQTIYSPEETLERYKDYVKSCVSKYDDVSLLKKEEKLDHDKTSTWLPTYPHSITIVSGNPLSGTITISYEPK